MSQSQRKIFSYEVGPPPKRRAVSPQDASQISASEIKNVHDVSQPAGDNGQKTKTAPLSSPSPDSKAQTVAPKQSTAVPKNQRPKRVVQTRQELDTMKLPVLSSLQAVEAYTHAPKALLSEIRKRNCTAFDPHGSGRVDVDVLFRWMFSNMTWLFAGENKDAGIGNLTWKGRTERANAILKEIAAAEAQQLTIKRDEVIFAVGKAMAVLFGALDTQSALLPPSLKGCDEIQIQTRLLAMTEAIKQTVRAELEKFTQEENVNNSNQQPTTEK